ncbi:MULTISPECIES: hypothetical protein [unclassified Bradyrhizobium]|nr:MULTISPECIES: hypothetical protein [unclassified Bradyrhizobium]MCK1336663.1 hypothetical protein [Bradyrhizobium sp. 38]MCK1656732.1 hypothetical protein [Bradyrhizobium sp. 151]MCK1777013.1 hypothetical protein [Bradyrhizobium sp. 132]
MKQTKQNERSQRGSLVGKVLGGKTKKLTATMKRRALKIKKSERPDPPSQ